MTRDQGTRNKSKVGKSKVESLPGETGRATSPRASGNGKEEKVEAKVEVEVEVEVEVKVKVKVEAEVEVNPLWSRRDPHGRRGGPATAGGGFVRES